MEISASLVRDLLREQFPTWADLPVEPVPRQGNDNRTFRLGDHLSVRLPSAEPYAAGITKENQALPIFSRRVTTQLPDVVGTGAPSELFPFPWSVRRWLPGIILTEATNLHRDQFAEDLAQFLVQLRSVSTEDGPACGQHSFFRGCHPSVYADQVQQSLAELGGAVDQAACRSIWQEGQVSAWPYKPVWFHGDIAEGNLLVQGIGLGAVIDFGTCGVGDPACDLVIAWTSWTRSGIRSATPSISMKTPGREHGHGHCGRP